MTDAQLYRMAAACGISMLDARYCTVGLILDMFKLYAGNDNNDESGEMEDSE